MVGEREMNYRQIIINTLIIRDGDCCRICGKPFTDFAPAELDHIKPKSNGGTDTIYNLHLVHSICNRRKNTKEWKGEINTDNLREIPFEKQFNILKINFVISELRKNSGNLTKTANTLGITRRRLTYFLKKNKLR
jgi:DNA-binding NtrC family response regulator